MGTANRLGQYLAAKGINKLAADALFGFSNGLTGKFLSDKINLSVRKIENILTVCPDLNGDWLLTGRGAMLINDTTHLKAIIAKNDEYESRIKDKDEVIKAQRELIKLYKHQAEVKPKSTN